MHLTFKVARTLQFIVDILWVGCDVTGVLTIVVDPALADELFDSVVGWYDPDDELIPLLGGDVLVAVVVSSGKQIASNNSVMQEKNV